VAAEEGDRDRHQLDGQPVGTRLRHRQLPGRQQPGDAPARRCGTMRSSGPRLALSPAVPVDEGVRLEVAPAAAVRQVLAAVRAGIAEVWGHDPHLHCWETVASVPLGLRRDVARKAVLVGLIRGDLPFRESMG
jgi:hypothetical protein